MIPEAKKTAVKNALSVTFGVDEFDAVSELTAGLSSALVFRIEVLKKPYLLRIITRTDAMGDPTHQYACMQPAVAAGLAPHIWYASIPDRISITDFIEAVPFPVSEARLKLPAIIRQLHSLPPFTHRVNYLDVADGFIRKFLAAEHLPDQLNIALQHQYERIIRVYPRNAEDLVASHNDLKPENILYDGNRVWLVDWEAAFLNDRYLDLAVVANFVVTNNQQEKDFLKGYFGEVNDYHHARFFLMQQILHLFYAAFLLSGVAAGVPIDPGQLQADFRSFHNGIWSGNISIAGDDARQQYARLHLKQFLDNSRLQRLDDSLLLVSGHQGSTGVLATN